MKDIYLIEDSGANSIRTCHYPNDELFLDICDERGIYVWEENHARGLDEENMQNPNFARQCEDCIDEMIKCHYNHPSIITWGILNECESTTRKGRAHYEKQFRQIKSLDATRPVTFASNKWFKDICLDLVDIVSFNIYSLWYTDEDPLTFYERLKDWIDTTPGKGKPIIVSEFGAGAVSGMRDPRRAKWTEEAQADIIDANLKVYLNREDITGVYIWQFCDCRVTEEKWAMRRPGCKNNKGIFDENRQPKLAYEAVKKHFRK
jgi:beta-glucuronidase